MIDTASDRMSLQNMEKTASESFHEYAHKWRDLAAQVQPPMTDKELNKTFLNTLKAPDRMSLQNMEKKANESFREYAHKWRDLAAQVPP